EMPIAPSRSALHVPIAIVDPHLGWYGQFRFYEARLYARDEAFNVSGVAILGVPLPTLGHSRYCSVAMTTGGPDTSDIFEEEMDPANRNRSRYDGQWRDLTIRKVTINVKNNGKVEPHEVSLAFSHHG